ncbi:peptide chain release factor N(5)-glutamine methyltransferase [Maridesulfovibrio hydrothermalis]|uniref:Release factor glutamine methyltransferase n=1 Tax=Maridesulfovibrio hydrothermalis AM13 = DSM 14728 TaxID=1121451 RepID=L0RFH8_9BACT|nr:peptide chain release factor N(5)-glutamine methyltransferase [Maridesulfovibrio hydrothermalis]CCO24967.1 Modification methylase, HemK family [Maridesulfovibrio hydrothermalis AM13 = DSM 14728]
MSNLTLKDILSSAASVLSEAGVDSPAFSAQLLAEKVFGLDRLRLIMDMNKTMDSNLVLEFDELVARRATGEPAAYILGEKEFFGLEFRVGPGVLIPRPETEEIVEKVQQLFCESDEFLFADFGTGSGVLAVTVAKLFPGSRGVALDLSPAALKIAQDNARIHGVDDRILFVCADFKEPLFGDDVLDLVLANPPYLCESELDEISFEVAGFEPVSALVSGAAGDEDIRGCAPHIATALKSGATMFMEIGYLQGSAALQIFESCTSFSGQVDIQADISGHDRFVVAQKK